MTRKIVSLYENYGYCFNHCEQRFLTEDKKIDNMIFPKGHLDIEWEKEKMPILLGIVEQKAYYSVVQETSIEMLLDGITNKNIDEEDYDIKIESDLDSEFTSKILQMNVEHQNKYNEDKEYLNYLGLPPLLEEIDIDVENPSVEES
jgi:hypothetical protein